MIILANPHAVEQNIETVLKDRVNQGYLKQDGIDKARQGPYKLYGSEGSEKRKIFAVKNAAFFAMSIMIAARQFGIETHPMDGFSEQKVKEAFSIPDDRIIPLLIAAGYPAPGMELLPRPRRRDLKDFVMKDSFEYP